MNLSPIPTVDAVATVGLDEVGGRTKPRLVTCYNSQTGETVDYVVKLHGHPEVSVATFVCEAIASQLATLLGIATPDIAAVLVPFELAAVSHDPLVRDSSGLNFGSRYLRDCITLKPDRVTPGMRAQALSIFAFDVLIDNVDRPAGRNLLVGVERLYVIDHEMAFAFRRAVGTTVDLGFLRRHVFFPTAVRYRDECRAALASHLRYLAPEVIIGIARTLPPLWQGQGADVVRQIHQHYQGQARSQRKVIDSIMGVLT